MGGLVVGDGYSFGKALIALIWPTREAFETGRFYGWRISIALMALTVTGVLVLIVRALGMATLLAASILANYAKADEVQDIKASQKQLAQKFDDRSNDIMGVVIGSQITTQQFNRCDATKKGNADLAHSYWDQLQGSLDQYYQVTHRSYNLLPCP